MFDFAGHDTLVCNLAYGSLVFCLLGYPDKALRMNGEAATRARQRTHSDSRAMHHFYTAMLHQLRQEPELVNEHARRTHEEAKEPGLQQRLITARIMDGWACVRLGHKLGGVERIEAGLIAWEKSRTELYRSYFLGVFADALRHVKD
ncbi:MAG: hypothetical protein ABW250_14855 [Pyrinomonadaceae bacterium]